MWDVVSDGAELMGTWLTAAQECSSSHMLMSTKPFDAIEHSKVVSVASARSARNVQRLQAMVVSEELVVAQKPSTNAPNTPAEFFDPIEHGGVHLDVSVSPEAVTWVQLMAWLGVGSWRRLRGAPQSFWT